MEEVCGLLASHSPLVPPYAQRGNGHCGSERRLLVCGGSGHSSAEEKHGGFAIRRLQRLRRCRRRHRAAAAVEEGNILSVCLRVAVFLLTLSSICLVALLLLPWTINDQNFADIPADDNDLRFVEVAKVCKEFTTSPANFGHCRTVVDIIDKKRDIIRRAMFFNYVHDAFESEVPLIPPNGGSIANSDTRLWRVNHTNLLNEYVAAMALMPFLLGSLTSTAQIPSEASRSALIIGLGGGSLDMFLHTKFPWIDITVYELDSVVVSMAEQWFEVINDETRRTLSGDGLQAIEQYARQGDRFDVVIVDACDATEKFTCPAAPFVDQSALQSVKSVLKPLGSFVMNVLPTNESQEEETIAQLQRQLLSIFPLCVRMRMGRQLNSIFACLPYSIDDNTLDSILPFWQQRKDQLARQFGLQQLLEGARLIASSPASPANH